MAAFRPLQPAPMDEETAPQPQSRPLLTQKPKRTVTLGACVACRKRKSKCDGNRPVCTCCSQKDTGCVYELGPNEKPSQAMKRKNEEMQGELSNLRQLYDFLRLRPEQEAMEILKRIRAKTSDTSTTQRIQELADFVRHGDIFTQPTSLPQPPVYHQDSTKSVTLPPLRLALDSPSNIDPQLFSLPSILSIGTDGPVSQRRRYASDNRVVNRSESRSSLPPPTSDSFLHRHPSISTEEPESDARFPSAQYWTSVTTDTDLLTSILTTWTSREYAYFHYFDKDAFLDDMAERRTDFCSELLVNALLATASITCPAVVDRSKPFSEHSIMTAFYGEARRLWQLEEEKDSLTRLQAGLCLYMFLGKLGRDKVAHEYLLEACRIGTNLGLYQSEKSRCTQHEYSMRQEKRNHVYAVTAWALFNFQLTMSYTYRFPAIIKTLPSVAIPYHHDSEVEALFRSECSRSIIMSDCNCLVQHSDKLGEHNKELPDSTLADTCYHRLLSWWKSRPASLHPDKVPSQLNLLCAMMYHTNIIDIFQPFLNNTPTANVTQAFMEYALQITQLSMKEIRRLLLLQDLRHGWASVIGIILHPLSAASFGSMNEISQTYSNPLIAEGSEQYQGLLVCLRALCAVASQIYYAQPLFRLVTQRCQAMNLRLPTELRSAIDAYTSDEWTKAAAALVSSQYIADVRRTAANAECARMDAIVSAWEGLNLEEQAKGKARVA